ncbi:hypothetical protein HQQ80_00770 [Microbacteriaceae bacterium VKM Ac-2855]|nr:hypothetical protein [Microbacteriaceae bacterium VKM Ac-2855]
MTAQVTIAAVLPDLLDSNGDAANARVLRARLVWAGVEGVELVALARAEDWASAAPPAALIVGTGASHDLPTAREALLAHGDLLSGWHADGTEIVAIGGGWELLSEGTQTPDGFVGGVGLFPGHAVMGADRVTDDVVVESAFGTLVGFENHLRRFADLPAGSALGTVRYGVGNGDGTEGFVSGRLLGSHLHGPLLAKNPALADAILGRIAGRSGFGYSNQNSDARSADETARAARDVIARRLGLQK